MGSTQRHRLTRLKLQRTIGMVPLTYSYTVFCILKRSRNSHRLKRTSVVAYFMHSLFPLITVPLSSLAIYSPIHLHLFYVPPSNPLGCHTLLLTAGQVIIVEGRCSHMCPGFWELAKIYHSDLTRTGNRIWKAPLLNIFPSFSIAFHYFLWAIWEALKFLP